MCNVLHSYPDTANMDWSGRHFSFLHMLYSHVFLCMGQVIKGLAADAAGVICRIYGFILTTCR